MDLLDNEQLLKCVAGLLEYEEFDINGNRSDTATHRNSGSMPNHYVKLRTDAVEGKGLVSELSKNFEELENMPCESAAKRPKEK